jgi:hypothetical protein
MMLTPLIKQDDTSQVPQVPPLIVQPPIPRTEQCI